MGSNMLANITLGVCIMVQRRLFPLAVFVWLSISWTLAFAEVPAYLLSSPGNPVVAVFAGTNQGFALGCLNLMKQWAGVPIHRVKPADWNATIVKLNIVAHVHCDSRTKKFVSAGQPGTLVILHEDGKYWRHYVDNVAWFDAISGPITMVDSTELATKIASNRGVDFSSNIQAINSKPSLMLHSPGHPQIAVFEPSKQAYALGCAALGARWDGVATKTISPENWDGELARLNFVAHIHCDSRVKKYQPNNEPGALVIVHTDGRPWRHYVDSEEWFKAIPGPVTAVDPVTFGEQIAQNRGVDLESDPKCRSVGGGMVCKGGNAVGGPQKPECPCVNVCASSEDGYAVCLCVPKNSCP